MPNGEEINRNWLVYSVKKDKVFCFCCRLFSTATGSSMGNESGISDWRHVAERLADHEKSVNHMKAFQSWMELSKRLKASKTIDDENQQLIKNETERWTEILKRLIYVVQFLASQNLAFRGSNDKIFTTNNGNFLKLIENIGKFDAVIGEHLRQIQNKETHVHYLGKNIQNEIIGLLGSKIKNQIISNILKWTYYSIILDCTPDVSHVEQLTIVIRYVSLEPDQKPEIHENFLGFIPIDSSTGEFLTNTLLEQLEIMKIPIQNMRGQGYDNGSNMKGKRVGVQKRILDLNPRAFYVPCNSHTLNLVVNDAALCCTEAVNFFSTVQEI